MILVDTNVLLRMAQRTHPMHALAMSAVDILGSRGESSCICASGCLRILGESQLPRAGALGSGCQPSKSPLIVAKIIERYRLKSVTSRASSMDGTGL